ncbi:MAG: peptidoglycan-binding domain-containing protein [Candidatus Zixiibacteriota bacterium]
MCHQEVEATTADVLLSFQKVPGVDADSIINGGDATLEGSDTPVRPQGNGYYGLRIAQGGTARLTVLGTTYVVKQLHGEINEPAPGEDICLAAWDTLGDCNANSGVGHGTMQAGIQRRLQLLGYYTGKVDGTFGKASEEAILRFQADTGLRTDGIAGNTTRTRLNTVTDDDNTTDGVFIIRRSLVRFERAPSNTDATVTSGRPWGRAPEPDVRGFIETKCANIDLEGPVVTMARETPFRLKLIRECLASNTSLMAESEDTALVEVVSPDPLPTGREIILQLRTKTPSGAVPRSTSVKIKFKRGRERIEIASLQVVVLPLIVKTIRPYWLTINGSDHDTGGVHYTGAMAPVGNQALINDAIAVANEILWPIGVRFRTAAWREKAVTLSRSGIITWGSVNAEYRTIMTTNDSEGHATEDNKLNLYVVRNIEGAFGITYSTKRYRNWPLVGIALASTGGAFNSTAVEIGRTLAHELGHAMALANGFRNPSLAHSEDDPDSAHKKTDFWSLKRLMYGLWPFQTRAANAWCQNVGYGNRNKGADISIRDNPADRTDNECHNARRHASSASFYRNP